MLVRSAMHQAGAAALSGLLRFAAPTADQRILYVQMDGSAGQWKSAP